MVPEKLIRSVDTLEAHEGHALDFGTLKILGDIKQYLTRQIEKDRAIQEAVQLLYAEQDSVQSTIYLTQALDRLEPWV